MPNCLRVINALLFAAALALHGGVAFAADGATLTVFAAASLKDALDEQVRQFEGETNTPVVVSYAGSNVLAKQIESGAPADLYISADLEWMDYLDSRKLLAPGSRHELLHNRLVLIAPSTSPMVLKIAPSFGLAAALGPNKLALGNPDSGPAGKYAEEALRGLGVWRAVERQVVRTDNVRAALALVAHGEASFGIVYASDARAEKNVRVVDIFPPSTHAPIAYPIAIVAASTSPATRAFIDFLDSALARGTWERFGFSVAQ